VFDFLLVWSKKEYKKKKGGQFINMTKDLFWDLDVKRTTMQEVLEKAVIALLAYDKEKGNNWKEQREPILDAWWLFNMFAKVRTFIYTGVMLTDYEDRIYRVVRLAFFEQRVPGYAPGYTAWDAEIKHELLKIICGIMDESEGRIRIMKGIVWEPRDEFSHEKNDNLIKFLNGFSRRLKDEYPK
jgi:hypothetical protein